MKYTGKMTGVEVTGYHFTGGIFSAVDIIRAVLPEHRIKDGGYSAVDNKLNIYDAVSDRMTEVGWNQWIVVGPSGSFFVYDDDSFRLAFSHAEKGDAA